MKSYKKPKNTFIPAINPNAKDEESIKFINRFGKSWELLHNSDSCYAIFDKKGKASFTLNDDEIAIYPEMTEQEFMNSYNSDSRAIHQLAIYQKINKNEKYLNKHLMELLVEYGCD